MARFPPDSDCQQQAKYEMHCSGNVDAGDGFTHYSVNVANWSVWALLRTVRVHQLLQAVEGWEIGNLEEHADHVSDSSALAQ